MLMCVHKREDSCFAPVCEYFTCVYTICVFLMCASFHMYVSLLFLCMYICTHMCVHKREDSCLAHVCEYSVLIAEALYK